MNDQHLSDDDLTARFHQAFDDATPDPLLWNRVESTVNRNTLVRRIAIVATAVAIPAVVGVAALAINNNNRAPEVPDVAGVVQTPPDGVELSMATYASVAGNRVTIDTSSVAEISDATQIDAIASVVRDGKQYTAAVVRYLDQDGATELRVDLIEWLYSTDGDLVGASTAPGVMFSQFTDATYTAAFTHDGLLHVLSSPDDPTFDTAVTTLDLFATPVTVSGRSLIAPELPQRIVGTEINGNLLAMNGQHTLFTISSDGAVSELSVVGASTYEDSFAPGAHITLTEEAGKWVIRSNQPNDMQDIATPTELDGAPALDVAMYSNAKGQIFISRNDQVWQLLDLDVFTWDQLPVTASAFSIFTNADTSAPTSVSTDSAPAAGPITDDTAFNMRGAGSVQIGMTLAEAKAVTGQNWVINHDFDGFCYDASVEGVTALGFMLTKDDPALPADEAVIVTVHTYPSDFGAAGVTDRGITLGSTHDELVAAYGELPEEPHNYDATWVYADTYGGDANVGFGIRFELDENRTVQAIRAGTSERQWSEGCA